MLREMIMYEDDYDDGNMDEAYRRDVTYTT